MLNERARWKKEKMSDRQRQDIDWSRDPKGKSDPLKQRQKSQETFGTSKLFRMIKRNKAKKKAGKTVSKALLRMTTPKAREKERQYVLDRNEDFVTVRSLMRLHALDEGTSELEKRCVYDVMRKSAKGPDGKPVKGARNQLSRAFAICRASLQKSGRIEKGGMNLTKIGGKVSGPKARKKDHDTKVAGYERDLKAARKK